MKRKTNTATGVYQYLERSGILNAGSTEEITQKRKEYWLEYKRKWKQEKRKKETEFKIYLTDKELQMITAGAKIHALSRTHYIKQAALAYAAKEYLVPDRATVNHVRQLLALNYAALQQISEDGNISTGMSDILLQRMANLEQTVLTILCNPKPTAE